MYQLFEQARMGPMTLKNRTVRSATNEHLSEPDGQLTQAWADVQTDLARGGVGLIITGHLTVDRTQRADEGQCVLDGETDLDLLRRTADQVHACGARLVAQLSHSGLKAPERVNGRPPKGPDDFTPAELDELVEHFRAAALLAQEAGLDGVQIHCAHGYLLSTFLNAAHNHRADGYGGDLEGRFRLPGRVIRAVRRACGPGFAVLVKVDCNSTDDLHGLLQLCQEAGADGAEISGLDFNQKAGERQPFYLEQAVEAARGLDLPLILVGGVFDRAGAQRVLDAGIPFVSMCRALICQPDYVNRMERGESSACLACNGCFQVYRARPVRCVQHTRPIPQLARLFGGEKK